MKILIGQAQLINQRKEQKVLSNHSEIPFFQPGKLLGAFYSTRFFIQIILLNLIFNIKSNRLMGNAATLKEYDEENWDESDWDDEEEWEDDEDWEDDDLEWEEDEDEVEDEWDEDDGIDMEDEEEWN